MILTICLLENDKNVGVNLCGLFEYVCPVRNLQKQNTSLQKEDVEEEEETEEETSEKKKRRKGT